MKKIRLAFFFVFFIGALTSVAYADLEVFLSNVNMEARLDMRGFSVNLSTQFGVPMPRVEAIVRGVAAPADAFMILQLSQMSHHQPEAVMRVYQRERGKGWGTVAKELGIKPGSREFHALQRGDFSFTGEPGGAKQEKGKGKGKGKGHNK